MKLFRVLLGFAILILLINADSFAVRTLFWEVSGFDSFKKGEMDGTTLSSEGYVGLGPGFDEIRTSRGSVILSLLPSNDGRSLYLGESHPGAVYRLDEGKDEAVLIFKSEELYVKAMMQIGKDLFVATAPKGKVYRLSDSEPEVYFEPEEGFIWSLASDTEGILYVGVGTPGRIYKVHGSHEAELFYETPDAFVTAMALDGKGTLVAGTYDSAMVLRIDSEGKGYALYDSPLQQVSQLAFGRDGTLYVVSISSSDNTQMTSDIKDTNDSHSGNGNGIEEIKVTASAPGSAATPGENKSQIHSIAPSGEITLLHELNDTVAYDMALNRENDTLWVGTGKPGHLYRVNRDKESLRLTEFPSDQITAVTFWNGRLAVGTSTDGKLYTAKSGERLEGEYISDIKDAGSSVRFGEISWIADTPKGATLELYVRCGNTAFPDGTWTDWAGPYRKSEGSHVELPLARYAQWSANFKAASMDGSPQLKKVRFAASPINRRPEVNYIQIYDPGVFYATTSTSEDATSKYLSGEKTALALSSSTNQFSGGKKLFKRGYRSFQWYTRDPDAGDVMEYTLEQRLLPSREWEVLAKDLAIPYYAWDTTSFPEGRYQVRVTVSDAPSNPLGMEKSASKSSDFFRVDHSPPSFGTVKVADGLLSFSVTDTMTSIAEVQLRWDEEEWVTVYPVDEVMDGRHEEFSVRLPDEAPINIHLKAYDRNQNVQVKRVKP